MKPLHRMQHILAKFIAERPWVGFATSLGITGTGFWTFIEGATKIGGFLVMCVGLIAAILNARVQKLAKEKLELEISMARRQESDSSRSQEPSLQGSSSPSGS